MEGPFDSAIDWHSEGKPDYLFGTGANTYERLLVWVAALGCTGIILLISTTLPESWNWWQIILVVLVCMDIGGGVVANSLNSCKRTYHTPPSPQAGLTERLMKNPMIFTAWHIHPILVGGLLGGSWLQGIAWYGLVLVSAFVVLTMPLYLKRPVAMGLVLSALFVAFYLLPLAPAFAWLGPALFLKIVLGHIVPEEPYRPPEA
ncbi:MAG: hypothetical protein ACK2UW_03655 [Anaerolineales bacterium]|jgi:hypothetical protein